jgi:uncharacterized membrane protein
MTSETLGSGESKLETVISYLLIIGVVASMLLEVVGLTLFYGHYASLDIMQNTSAFVHGENFFSFVATLFQGEYTQNTAFLFMTIGVVVLILTPYVRVVTSVIYFAWKKNRKYVLMTLFVLIVLTISLALH